LITSILSLDPLLTAERYHCREVFVNAPFFISAEDAGADSRYYFLSVQV
jgi:hypothetical protein